MVRISVLLTGGLTLIAVAIVAALARSPDVVAHTNGAGLTPFAGAVTNEKVCQGGETVPAGTSAIRLSLESSMGPPVSVEARTGSGVLTRGRAGSGWTSKLLTVPVTHVGVAASNVTICSSFRLQDEYINLLGKRGPVSSPAFVVGVESLPGRLRIDYLRPGHRRWWSALSAVVRHMGLDRAQNGVVLFGALLVLMLTAVALAARLVVRELG